MSRYYRHHQLWYAYALHRFSGLALALFLPIHFWVLSLALRQPDKLNRFFAFADNPLVKAAEFGLVFLLSVHAFGGIRLLALEFLPWSSRQKTMSAIAFSFSLFIAIIFLLKAI